MIAIVQRVERPAMLMREIKDARERGILKTETHSRRIDMGSNANDRVHQLIEQPAVRNDQVTARRPMQEFMQSLAGPQEERPIAFSFSGASGAKAK